MRLLLITGFLGSGKTTFLKELLAMQKGKRLSLIVNEFGRVGVDGELLLNLGASMREVVGGSIFCTCRLDQFEEALLQAIQENPELILVEASGLSDPTAIRTVLSQHPEVDYQGCVALCDAASVEKVLSTARVCAKQLSVSDLILLNKTDLVSAEEAARLQLFLSKRFPLASVQATIQGKCLPEWLDAIDAHAELVSFQDSRDITLQKAYIAVSSEMTREQCASFVKLFVEETYRVKGFVRLAEGWFLTDCVGAYVHMQPCELAAGQESGLVALAGQGMNLRRSLKEAVKWYGDFIQDVRFD